MEGGKGNEVATAGQVDLAASLEEMEKLDAVLKMKVAEEKRARLSTIQTEEESRDVLSRLRSNKLPDRIQINVEQFMKLLNEIDKTESDASPRLQSGDVHGIAGIEPENDEKRKDGKTSGRQQNAGTPTFVQRNILLAKCGRGTLSLTDEEKSRIANLLVNLEDTDWNTRAKMPQENQLSETASEYCGETYAIDDETKSILGEIDQRLEALAKLKTPKGPRSETELEKSDPERNGSEENEERSRGGGRRKEKGSRLEEINKLLNSMNSASEEEVNPLAEEELEGLLKESSGGESGGRRLPQEVVAELVSSAKLLMPKFRYRFDES